jgi:hypothetical protein
MVDASSSQNTSLIKGIFPHLESLALSFISVASAANILLGDWIEHVVRICKDLFVQILTSAPRN